MVISYEQIKAVNAELKTTDVKGKDYAEVPQRVTAFRKLHPMGSIKTEIVSLEAGVCVIRAEAWTKDDEGNDILLGTGLAYEKEGSSFINNTSYIENCETSAVGRALGFCGIGIDTSIASAEEVLNAKENQKAMQPISKSECRVLEQMMEELGTDTEKFLKYYKVKNISDMTKADYVQASKVLNSKIDRANA